MKNPKILRCI